MTGGVGGGNLIIRDYESEVYSTSPKIRQTQIKKEESGTVLQKLPNNATIEKSRPENYVYDDDDDDKEMNISF